MRWPEFHRKSVQVVSVAGLSDFGVSLFGGWRSDNLWLQFSNLMRKSAESTSILPTSSAPFYDQSAACFGTKGAGLPQPPNP